MVLKGIKVGLGMTGSFCTFDKVVVEIQKMMDAGAEVIPIMTDCASDTDTRFGKAEEFKEKIKAITGRSVIDTITGAEPLGPNNLIDVMVIAPCTGNAK